MNATELPREPSRAILRPEQVNQHMVREVIATERPLSLWVSHVWSLAWSEPVPASSSVLIPHPTMHLTLEAGPAGEVRHGHQLPAPLLHGVPAGKFSPELPAGGWAVGLHLAPGAIFDLTGTPAHTWTGRVVSLPRAWTGWDSTEVWQAPGPRERAELLHALACRVIGAASPSPDGWRARTVERLVLTDRSIDSVAELAERMDVTTRRLQRLCRDHLGVSPRWLLRRARVLDAHELLSTTDMELADIAHQLGYYDQAHLTRDYTTITGIPPARLRRILGLDRSDPSQATTYGDESTQ